MELSAQDTQLKLPRVWQVPMALLCDPRGVGSEALLLYLLLWQMVGCKPGKLVPLSYIEFAAVFGRSERSARRWIERLAQADLIEIIVAGQGLVELRVRSWKEDQRHEQREILKMPGGIDK